MIAILIIIIGLIVVVLLSDDIEIGKILEEKNHLWKNEKDDSSK